MRTASLRAAAVLCFLVGLTGDWLPQAEAQHSRRTPIVEAVARARPSIVTIKAQRRASSRESVGTGVIVDERGYIVTCHHVVAGAWQLKLRLSDDTELTPQVVMSDPSHDLAVLQIQTSKTLTALPFGPSRDLLVGETVIAVGHPFGYSHTASTGILSAVDREIAMPGEGTMSDLIQTTASINPGNSGGPLLNINGEWIGMVLALREGAQGIAFAVKSETVQQVLSQRLSALKVAGLSHGLQCQETISEEQTVRQRVQVHAVAEQGPAAEAGVQRGDTILYVANRPVTNRFDVERALWDCRAGEQIEVTVLRQDREMRVKLTLGRAGEAPRARER